MSVAGQTGVFKSYHLNGKKSAEISYSDGIYDGTSYWYYPNGNLQEEKTFSNGKINGWCRTFYESGLLKEEKFVENGVIDGIQKRYFANGALKSVMSYENGILVKNIEFDYDPYYKAPIDDYRAGNKQQVESKKTDEFLCDVKICPEPLGGMESIYEKLKYPADAVAYGLEGEVRLLASINKDGNVLETKIIRGIGLGCDEAAIDAVKKTRFLPGQNDSGPTTSNLTLSVKFTLKDGEPVVHKKLSPDYMTERVAEPEIGIASTTKDLDRVQDNEIAETTQKDKKNELTQSSPQPFAPDTKVGKLFTDNPITYFNCKGYDICAQPAGGINSVLRHFKIPNRVKEKNVQGEVIVVCEVDKDGNVRKTKVQQGLPEGADIAVEVALLDTKFEPAMKDGKPVRSNVTVTVPVRY